jgi:3-deoxy-D-manno-octulosonic-acid transferase
MVNAYDIAYGLGLTLAAPVWLIIPKTRRKVLKALRERMGHVEPRAGSAPAVMIHAVSLGEMNATRAMVAKLREARPGMQFVISTTTDAGFERAAELYGAAADCRVIRYPLDFSPAVARALDATKPTLVVLLELEVWPNFMRQCQRRQIPVLLVNGRLTESSFRGYKLAGPFTGPMFRRLTRVCAQEQAYADRFIQLGTLPDRVRVTGTMKFDTAEAADRVDGDAELARAVGLRLAEEPVWVCGSTGPGEEEITLEAYRELLMSHPTLRLVIVPRHKPRWDEVADLIKSFGFPLVRRSNAEPGISDLKSPVILGDTFGELRTFYSLADVVLVARTLVDLGPRQHGSDMIEPAALAKPVIVGPFTGNFAEPMNAFRGAKAIEEIQDPNQLASAVGRLLTNPTDAAEMGRRAQEVVRSNQGATQRHVDLILEQLNGRAT